MNASRKRSFQFSFWRYLRKVTHCNHLSLEICSIDKYGAKFCLRVMFPYKMIFISQPLSIKWKLRINWVFIMPFSNIVWNFVGESALILTGNSTYPLPHKQTWSDFVIFHLMLAQKGKFCFYFLKFAWEMYIVKLLFECYEICL